MSEQPSIEEDAALVREAMDDGIPWHDPHPCDMVSCTDDHEQTGAKDALARIVARVVSLTEAKEEMRVKLLRHHAIGSPGSLALDDWGKKCAVCADVGGGGQGSSTASCGPNTEPCLCDQLDDVQLRLEHCPQHRSEPTNTEPGEADNVRN